MERPRRTSTLSGQKPDISCHYCNELINPTNLKFHLVACEKSLQMCPNNCVAFIQRKNLDEHLKECPKNLPKSQSNDGTDDDDGFDFEQLYSELEKNIGLLRSCLQEEIRQRHRLIIDVGALRKETMGLREQCAFDRQENQFKLDSLLDQQMEIQRWRKDLRRVLDGLQKDLEFKSGAELNFEVLFSGKDLTISKIQSLENEIQYLKAEHKKMNNKPSGRLGLNLGSTQSLGGVERCGRCPFLEWKLSESLIEIRQLKNTVCESEVKVESSLSTIEELHKKCAATKQELEDLKVHLAAEKRLISITNTGGHLIWRIDNYTEKLNESKESGLTHKSPIFCNQQYGYNLRLEISLNGFGTWKGRNILACVNVIPGEWDPLLPWPCKLKADIFLRNQSADDSSAQRDFAKNIMVKKQDAKYDRSQYIFIPHRLATSFVKNDTIFFEVFVQNS